MNIPKFCAFSTLLDWYTEGEVRVLQWRQSYLSCLHVVITLKFVVAKMIFQNWSYGSLSMADRGFISVFENFTRRLYRSVQWHWHCTAKRCHAQREQLSYVAQGAFDDRSSAV
jgi:hypothetical protein